MDHTQDDIEQWANSKQLSEKTVKVLKEEDFTSLDDLRELSPDDVVTQFQKTKLLTGKECMQLNKAIGELCIVSGHKEGYRSTGEVQIPIQQGRVKTLKKLYSKNESTTSGYKDQGHTRRMANEFRDAEEKLTCYTDHDSMRKPANDFRFAEEEPVGYTDHSFMRQTASDFQVTEDKPVSHTDQGPVSQTAKYIRGTEDETDNTIRLLLLGRTGTGKSTTGNTILGQEAFSSAANFASVTSKCELRVGVRGDIRFEIMDSPGLYDTSKTHEEICTVIVQAVAGMHPGPHAVLYVISVGRYTHEEFQAYCRLKVLFDESIVHHIILLFTHGDKLKTNIQDQLLSSQTPDSLKQVLKECGHRYLLFNNTLPNSQPMVDCLLKEVRDLVVKNEGRPYVCPKYSKIGEGMEEEVQRRLQKYEEEDLKRKKYVQKLEVEAKEAQRSCEEAEERFRQREARREQEEKEAKKRMAWLETELKEQKELSREQAKSQIEEVMLKMQKMQEDRDRELQEKEKKKEEQEAREYKRKQAEKEEAERKEAQRQHEMDKLKQSVVEHENTGFFGHLYGVVSSPFRAIGRWFNS